MPEGPEIRLAADKIASVLLEDRIESVYFAFDHLKKYEKKLAKSHVVRVETRGKAMLTVFANEWVIYSHNQLYGVWKIIKNNKEAPTTKRQLRLKLTTEKGSALLYSASDIAVMRLKELDKHPFLSRLGPDVLSESPSIDDIFLRFQSNEFRNKQLASLLLDQHFLAGLGNYLRAEILHFAKLHPNMKPIQCTEIELKRLAKTTLTLVQRSYRTGGITNPPALAKKLRSEGKREKESYRFSCYGRENLPCYTCAKPIKREERSGRAIFFCSHCQIEST